MLPVRTEAGAGKQEVNHCLCCLPLQVITDPLTGRSKGYGFVRFGSEAERDRALGDMMGHLISNRPIRVSIATAKKNPPGAPSANAASSNAPHPSDFDLTNTTLFIGGLSASVTEDELHSLFGRFGDIIYVKIPPGKGCGFVQYVLRPVAEVAMATMQSQVGHPLLVSQPSMADFYCLTRCSGSCQGPAMQP